MRTLADFIGTWRLEREILQADGGRGTFSGTAVWQAEGAGAVYVERGLLRMGQGAFTAERRHLWDAGLRVFFADGRFFHAVPPGGGDAGHWCDPDQYDVRYAFDTWPDWSCTWRVRGPRKDYRMHSRYCRAAA